MEFESEEVVKNVVATHYHTIDGKQVRVCVCDFVVIQ